MSGVFSGYLSIKHFWEKDERKKRKRSGREGEKISSLLQYITQEGLILRLREVHCS